MAKNSFVAEVTFKDVTDYLDKYMIILIRFINP